MENLQGGTLALEHRYEVERHLGRYAFVTLYEGSQHPFDKSVTIKVYDALGEWETPPDVARRLQSAARDASRLDVEGVLQPIDYGEVADGVPFIVSERCDGKTLEQRLADSGPLSLEETVTLVDRLAQILEQAHARDIYHGTLSPRWIRLPDDRLDRARLEHFQVGLALGELRRMEEAILTPDAVCAFPPESFARETVPPDAAPEERYDHGEEFTRAADVYGLGLITYIALSGFHPYFDESDATDASSGLLRIQHEDAEPLSDYGVDTDVSEAVERALARQPQNRWSSARAFADALRTLVGVEDDGQGQTTDRAQDAAVTGEFESLSDDAPQTHPPAPSEPEQQYTGGDAPSPSSTLLTLAIGLFVLSNIAWFFYFMDARTSDERAASESEAPATSILPGGASDAIELRTVPPGARVFYRGDQEDPVGDTPFILPATMFENGTDGDGTLSLDLRKSGHLPARIDLTPGPDSNLTVHLKSRQKAEP